MSSRTNSFLPPQQADDFLHHAVLLITNCFPRTFTEYCSNGLGGGPAMFLPFRSKWPLWQAHQIWLKSDRYWTMQARCVQTAEKARRSPVGVRTKIPAWFPKRKICPELGLTSSGLTARVTLRAVDSSTSGGTRYRAIG